MITITHNAGSFKLQTESDIEIPHIKKHPFNMFCVEDSPSDICYRIREIDKKSLVLPPLNLKERELISACVDFKPNWMDYPVWRIPKVREILSRCLVRPEMVNININWNGLYVRNFKTNEFDLFYLPERKWRFSGRVMIASFRNLLPSFLINLSRIMIHSAGVIRNGRAALFLAPDEGGKTSVVKQSKGVPVLNDDHIILKREDSFFYAYATPFGLISDGPAQAKVGAFFLLEKGSRFEIIHIKFQEVFRSIFQQQLPHWRLLPKNLKKRAFTILNDACKHVPLYRMRFPKDYVDWDAIDDAIGNNDSSNEKYLQLYKSRCIES